MTRVAPQSPARGLSDEETELWLAVAASVQRRPGSTLPGSLAKPKRAEILDVSTEPAAGPIQQELRRPPPLPTLSPLEQKLRQKLSRGRQAIDAAIDLHGFRQDQAHRILRQFLIGAQAKGARVVLVVTGKGETNMNLLGPTTEGRGILRRMVPLWLALPEFRAMVSGYGEAAQQHGGAGALYVRLRRNRLR